MLEASKGCRGCGCQRLLAATRSAAPSPRSMPGSTDPTSHTAGPSSSCTARAARAEAVHRAYARRRVGQAGHDGHGEESNGRAEGRANQRTRPRDQRDERRQHDDCRHGNDGGVDEDRGHDRQAAEDRDHEAQHRDCWEQPDRHGGDKDEARGGSHGVGARRRNDRQEAGQQSESGTSHRNAAPGATVSATAASAIHTGSAMLHTTSGCLMPCARAGNQCPRRTKPQPTVPPTASIRRNNRSGRAYHG